MAFSSKKHGEVGIMFKMFNMGKLVKLLILE